MIPYNAPSAPALLTANPFLAFWMMPFVLTQAWMTACLGERAPDETRDRNLPDSDQLPVPPVIQDSKDEAIFA
ncbi:MAG: hypothetical protein ABW184_02360 [Sphingobium sp.]